MKGIGAGLGDHIHHRRAGAAQFRGKAIGGDLKFLYRVFRNIEQHAADNVVVVVHTVNTHIATAPQLSGGRNHHRILLGRIEVGRDRVPRH